MSFKMKYERDLYVMQQIFATVFTLSNKLQIEGDKTLEILTIRQLMTILAVLHLPEGKATLSAVAKKLGTSRQNEKQLVSLMEKKGLVTTTPSKTDKRASCILITQKGIDAVLTGAEHSISLFSKMFAKFTTNDLETLFVLLKKLYHFDGSCENGFEKNVNYGEDAPLSEKQICLLKDFDACRATANGVERNEK